MAKGKKERAEKYEEKVKFDGSFDELIKIAVNAPEKAKDKKKGVK